MKQHKWEKEIKAWADKQAQEQPAQSEYMVNEGGTGTVLRKPAQSWQGLTDDEIDAIIKEKDGVFGAVCRAIEQALKEKNTS
jgi:hypothetical protein